MIEDALCPGCGQIPEMFMGGWVPHHPGARCPPGEVECGDGLHVFPSVGGSCQCGGDFLAAAPPPVVLSPPWYLEP